MDRHNSGKPLDSGKTLMTKMIIYTTGTVKIVENPSIVEKFQMTEESAIEGFYCNLNHGVSKQQISYISLLIASL